LIEQFKEEKRLSESHNRILAPLQSKVQYLSKYVEQTSSDLAKCQVRLEELSNPNAALVRERD